MWKTEGRIPLPSICPWIFLLCVPYNEISSVSPGIVCHQPPPSSIVNENTWMHKQFPGVKTVTTELSKIIVRAISPPYYGKTSHNFNSQTPPILVSSSKGTHKSASLTTHWCTCSSTRRSNIRNDVLGAKKCRKWLANPIWTSRGFSPIIRSAPKSSSRHFIFH